MNSKKIEGDSQLNLEQLKAESELKSKWLSLIAHDFKGLFSNINVLLGMLESKSITQEMFMTMLPEIKQITEKNIKTLDSTFAWVNSQTNGFNPHFEEVKIYDLFLQLKDELSEYIGLKELSLEFVGDIQLTLCTDRLLITFIMKQVLDNAIKYSNIKDKVGVEVHSYANKVSITVNDKGVGMKERVRKNVGTLNESPYTGTMDEKGAGLSLVVVKSFVEKLDGEMSIVSNSEEGTSVELTFLQKTT